MFEVILVDKNIKLKLWMKIKLKFGKKNENLIFSYKIHKLQSISNDYQQICNFWECDGTLFAQTTLNQFDQKIDIERNEQTVQ